MLLLSAAFPRCTRRWPRWVRKRLMEATSPFAMAMAQVLLFPFASLFPRLSQLHLYIKWAYALRTHHLCVLYIVILCYDSLLMSVIPVGSCWILLDNSVGLDRSCPQETFVTMRGSPRASCWKTRWSVRLSEKSASSLLGMKWHATNGR